MTRIRNFDKFINKDCIKFYSENGISTKIFDKSLLTSDEIDAVIEEFCACKAHISLILSFDIPGKASASISITEKETLEQEIGYFPTEGYIDLKISFLMSNEQREAQLMALREAGIQGYVFKISDDDEYIDYGELDSRCKISLKVKLDSIMNFAWRSEEIQFESVATESGKEDGYIHGLMIDLLPDENGKDGYLMVGIATPMSMFMDTDIEDNAVPFERDLHPDEITLKVDTDVTPLIPKPKGYDEWLESMDSSKKTPEIENYSQIVAACNQRKLYWKTLFETKEPFLVECIKNYSSTLVGTTQVERDNSVQVKWNEYIGWLRSNYLDERFFEKFNPILSKAIQQENKFQQAEKIADKIKSEETIQKFIEVNSAMKEFTEKLYEITNSAMTNVSPEESVILQNFLNSPEEYTENELSENPKIKEVIDNINNIKSNLHIDDLMIDLTILVALDSEFITSEQAQLPRDEVVELLGYKAVFEVIREIITVYNNETVKKFVDANAIQDIINPETEEE